MSQENLTSRPQVVLPPIYQKSFVGIWKRMNLSGRPDPGKTFLFFNGNGTGYGPIGVASRRGIVQVDKIIPDPGFPQKGLLRVIAGGTPVEWTYTLNRNNDFKKQFHPIPGTNKTPPVLNELLLVGQGARHLYAFFSHPFRPIMTAKELQKMID